jgi:hypothetical protein
MIRELICLIIARILRGQHIFSADAMGHRHAVLLNEQGIRGVMLVRWHKKCYTHRIFEGYIFRVWCAMRTLRISGMLEHKLIF